MLQAPAGSTFQTVLSWTAGIGLAAVVLGLVVGIIPPPKHVLADSSRIVSVYYDGQKKVITTNAPTVGEALQAAGVSVSDSDAVEPKASTPIPVGFFNVNVYRSRPVVVVDGQIHKTVQTASQSPRLMAQAAGLTTYDQDTYDVATINDPAEYGVVGQEVTIHRSVPVVLSGDGQQTKVRTQAKTVGDLLKERDVAFGPQDSVTPTRDTPISPNLTIQLNRVREVVLSSDEAIARDTKTIQDNTMQSGQTKIEAEGSDGTKRTTYRVHYTNGGEDGRQLLSQQVTKQPVTKVVRVGTKPANDSWARLRQCESGGNYANKRNPNYRGAYQFGYSTWASVGGHGDPADASPAEQDMRAQLLYNQRGWSPWECARILGL